MLGAVYFTLGKASAIAVCSVTRSSLSTWYAIAAQYRMVCARGIVTTPLVIMPPTAASAGADLLRNVEPQHVDRVGASQAVKRENSHLQVYATTRSASQAISVFRESNACTMSTNATRDPPLQDLSYTAKSGISRGSMTHTKVPARLTSVPCF